MRIRGAPAAARGARSVEPGWLEAWREADATAAARDRVRARRRALRAARRRRLGAWLPTRRRRCSSPPRCRSATSRSSPARGPIAPRVLSNRGANGIDGTVSARSGSRRRHGPTVLLIGDVALAHDIGGPARGAPARAGADDRAAQQRRRRDLPFPAGRRRGRRVRGARRDAARARLRARGRAVRVRLRAARRRSTRCGTPSSARSPPPTPRSSR